MADESMLTAELLDMELLNKAVKLAKEEKPWTQPYIFLYPSEINCWDLVCAIKSSYPCHIIHKIGLVPR